MKAITQDRYGPLEDVQRLSEIEPPEVRDDGVLVRVHAASIHIGDVFASLGVPYVMRPIFGVRRPRARVPGSDVAGTVEAVGSSVTDLRPGDEVIGWCRGAFAELAMAPASQWVAKPADMSFEDASTLVTSAITALQGMRDKGGVKPGDVVLVNGAAGGVGSFAVQVAKALGARVTAVCSARNVETMRSIGADEVIDYTTDDFTAQGPRYDLIFDNVGNHSLSATRRALKPDGVLLSNGAPVGGWFGGLDHVISTSLVSMVVRQQARPFLSLPSQADLTAVRDLVVEGRVRPVIDRVVPLAGVPQAMAEVGARHTRGKVVIAV
jgi:NADPH:quinone reductase-like Zn-dependent oxidoreductase